MKGLCGGDFFFSNARACRASHNTKERRKTKSDYKLAPKPPKRQDEGVYMKCNKEKLSTIFTRSGTHTQKNVLLYPYNIRGRNNNS
jgi:hypothetical protein